MSKLPNKRKSSKSHVKTELDGTEKDGFDFIEYPCEYMFKALCRVKDGDLAYTEVALRELALLTVSSKYLLVVRSTSSRTGKFQSITLRVMLSNRQQLEEIYEAIASNPLVVMTL